jgi:hypothetical protein
MKTTAVETIKELQKASSQYPAVIPFLGAVLELDEPITTLEQPQDAPSAPVSEQDISRANLQKKFSVTLLSAGTDKDKLARLFLALRNLQ